MRNTTSKGLALVDLTPAEFRCAAAMSCPAVFQLGEDEYLIIGAIVDSPDPLLQARIGPNEVAIRIASKLLEGAVRARGAAR